MSSSCMCHVCITCVSRVPLATLGQDRALLAWCVRNEVAYTSYSTLGGQWVHQALEGSNRVARLNPVFER
jgi:hypothetical protein